MDVLESMLRMSSWHCRDLHFVMTHSLAQRQQRSSGGVLLDTVQHLFKPWTGYVLKILLSIINICMVTPAVVRAAAVTMAISLATETNLSCPYMPRSCPTEVRHPHLRVSVHLRVHVGGWVPAPKRSKFCSQLHPAAKLSFCKPFILKSQKHNDQTTVSEQS